MSVRERLMATGDWSLRLREDTPRAILDLITPFSMVGIFPNAAPIAQADANVLASARYIGIVHRPGPQLDIGGPGLAAWLGQGDVCYDVDGTATLPETRAYSVAGSTLNTWLDSHVIPGTPFTRGTTGPSGTMTGSFQWVSQRDLLEALCAHYAAEWRIRTGLQLDVAGYTTLYGSTPTVVISRYSSGRDLGYTSVQGDIESSLDVTEYASRVVVLGSGARAATGGSSAWKGPENVAVKATRIIDAPDIPGGSESSAATSYLSLFNSTRREVRLSTDHFDVSGDIGVGALVWLFDPDAGIVDNANPIPFRGDTIRPVVVRCMGLSWPIRQGMGVALRTNDGGVVWTDLTPYVEWEDGPAEIEIGAAQQFTQGDQLTLRADLRPALQWSPWQDYAVEWRASITNPTLGNGVLSGSFRRMGTSLQVRITLAIGTTSAGGSGAWAFTMPPNTAAKTVTDGWALGTAMYHRPAVDSWPGRCYVANGTSTIYLTDNSSPWVNTTSAVPFAWAAGHTINVFLQCEVDA